MSLETTGTILAIYRRSDNALLLPLYSMRGLTQTLDYIDMASQFERSVNAKLIDFGHAQYRLFQSTLSVTDVAPLPLGLLFPGLPVTLECAHELSYRTSGGSAERAVVTGSEHTEGDFTFYRPSLACWITDRPSVSFNEWEALYTTTIKFEEDGTA